jgi:membrane protease YdiL (CAAX protease family)
METALIVFFLAVVLSPFSPPVQAGLKAWFGRARWRVFLIPAALTGVFAAALAARGAWSWPFLLLAAAYTLVPTLLVYAGGRWLDLAAILALWLPVEFTAGKDLLPRHAWGAANLAAHGVAVALGLYLFLIFRDLKGMKYNLPRKATDLLYPALGFLAAFPILAALGLKLGFMGPFRGLGAFHAGAFGLLWLKTLVGVALPEELLFRALIQNWLMQNFGFSHRTLAAAALVFGAAHLDNPPGPLPNWRYMILASIAGFVFGKVFWKSSTILSSAGLHAMVNSVRHVFFL